MSKNAAFYTIAGLLVAIVGTFATILTVPEVREALGLGLGDDPPPEDEPTTPQTDYSGWVGVYTGESVNQTMRMAGTSTLDIRDIRSPYGNARANVEWGGNLSGTGSLSGTVDQNGSLDLAGDIHACAPPNCQVNYIYDGDISCKLSSRNKLDCNYTISPRQGNPYGKQEGTMSLTKR